MAAAPPVPALATGMATPIPVDDGATDAVIRTDSLENEEEAHLAEVGEGDRIDAALESTQRTWDLPLLQTEVPALRYPCRGAPVPHEPMRITGDRQPSTGGAMRHLCR